MNADPHSCPHCLDGGWVFPYAADSRGKVSHVRCLRCNTNFPAWHERKFPVYPPDHLVWIVQKPRERLHFNHFHFSHYHPKEIHHQMTTTTVHDDAQPFGAHLVLLDAQGNPTGADDIPTWTSSDETVASVSSTTPNGLSAIIHVAKPGECDIVASTTDNNGTKIVLTGHLVVEAGAAVSGEIAFDTPAPAPVAVSAPAPAITDPSAAATPAAPADTTTPAAAPTA